MKSLIAIVLVLAAVLVNCMSAHAFSFGGGGISLKGCIPTDTTPETPGPPCSLHQVMNEKGGSAPTVFELIVGTMTVPAGKAALVCTNGGGQTTFKPGLGGVTFISVVNGNTVFNFQNGKFSTEHIYKNHIVDFSGDVVAFRAYWNLPLDHTLCRNANWSELMIIPDPVFLTGAIYSKCEVPGDQTTCQLDATIQADCTLQGKVTPTTPEWTYDCKNIVIDNNPPQP